MYLEVTLHIHHELVMYVIKLKYFTRIIEKTQFQAHLLILNE